MKLKSTDKRNIALAGAAVVGVFLLSKSGIFESSPSTGDMRGSAGTIMIPFQGDGGGGGGSVPAGTYEAPPAAAPIVFPGETFKGFAPLDLWNPGDMFTETMKQPDINRADPANYDERSDNKHIPQLKPGVDIHNLPPGMTPRQAAVYSRPSNVSYADHQLEWGLGPQSKGVKKAYAVTQAFNPMTSLMNRPAKKGTTQGKADFTSPGIQKGMTIVNSFNPMSNALYDAYKATHVGTATPNSAPTYYANTSPAEKRMNAQNANKGKAVSGSPVSGIQARINAQNANQGKSVK